MQSGKKNQKISQKILEYHQISLSSRTVRRRLNAYAEDGLIELQLKSHSFQKKTKGVDWILQKAILWSDQSKFKLFGSDSQKYVGRKKGSKFDRKYQIPTIKHDGANIMVWVCFSSSETGSIIRIYGIIDRSKYKDFLQNIMLSYAEEEMPLRWLFQRFIRTGKNNIPTMKRPSQRPDLNLIDLWENLDKHIRKYTITNSDQLFKII